VVEAAGRSVDAVKKLSEDIKIPYGLEAFGAGEEHVSRLAKDTFKIQRLLKVCSRPVTEEDLVELFKSALKNY